MTLPLIWRGVLVGGLFSFMTSLQEASAVLFLALGGWEGITNGIFTFYIAGSASEAAALGVILIALAAISTVVINRIAGTRMGGVFGWVVARSRTAHPADRPMAANRCVKSMAS